MFNLSDMMGKFQEMQNRLKEVKEQLEDITVESEAGGGMVRVTANGNRKVLKIHIDPDIIDKDDPEIMSDLITAAVNKALDKAEIRGREEIEGVTKGMLPNIPGLDLGKMGLG
ncbi:MAG: YbaB/EbfC family nucleoid-associated protein [Bacteroidetes bacterium]|nr:YbaB/EbfC family nucleoid-associated protein [Bacteroidota bacterium]MCB0851900.1 YbaB/EbfC family nucleoid-associated protein [Bacteroidota bacterium]